MTVIWLTGLSGAGKTTLGNSIVDNLKMDHISILIDGDEIRKGLNSDLGFSVSDRIENVRRVAHMAKLLSNKGFFVIVSLITPTGSMRKKAKEIIGKNFVECYVKASIETCIKRDVKGLYEKAINGEMVNFTGVSSIYEAPVNPDLVLDTEKYTTEECAKIVLNYLNII